MAESLVIRLTDTTPEHASWVVVDNAGVITGSAGSGPLTEAARRSDQRRVVAIVPAADVLLTHASLPVKGTAKMLQAVPFALEEQLADDIDKLHFAVGQRGSDGRVPVAVARREQVAAWLQSLQSAGLTPAAMMPDTALLPANDSDGPTLLVDGRNTYVRQADASVAVIASDSFAEVASAVGLGAAPSLNGEELPASETTPARACLFISQDDADSYPELVSAVEQRFPACELRSLQFGAFARLAADAADRARINLLQGAFAPTRSHAKIWRAWRGTAILLGLLIVVLLGSKAVQVARLNALDRSLDEQTVATFEQAFPGVRVVDPVAQTRNAVTKLRGGAGAGQSEFLDMLDTVAAVFARTPAATLQSLRYGRDQLEIKLIAPNGDTLETLRTAIENGSTFSAQIRGANPRGDSVEGRIEVRRDEN